MKKILGKTIAYLRPYWFKELVVIFLIILGSVSSLAFPYIVKIIIDDVFPAKDFGYLIQLLVILLGINVVGVIFSFCADYLFNWVSNQVMLTIRKDLFNHFLRLPLRFYDEHKTGDIVHRINNEVNIVQRAITISVIRFTWSTLSVITITVFLCLLDFELFIICVVLLPFFLMNIKYFQPRIRQTTEKARQKNADILGFFMQRFENVKIVQAFNRFRYEDSRLTAEIKNLIGLNMKNVVYASSTRNISFLIMSLGPIIIFGWGGHQVIKGAVTLGTLVAFLQYLRRLFIPLRDLMEVYVELVKASVSMRRVVEFLEIPVPVDEADKSGDVSFEDTITFRDVDFGYNEQRILDQFNFEIEKGRRYALVGPSGCGKSTIVNLLCGFYKPGNGTILIDDRPLNDLDLAGWREQIALVPQDDHLFREPIWKNIQYGNLNSTPGEVENIMHLVGLSKQPKFMKKGKQGTVEGTIGDRGRTLSGGIKQRIAIARAMLKEADLLIMDEATSQLDSESEKRILDNIKERSPGLTLLLISHRMAVIKDVDEIIYMDRGKVMEKGSHKELMAKKGFYWTFFKEQIQD